MPWTYTDDAKGGKEVKLSIAGHEVHRVEAMLSFTAEGHKFEICITVIKTLPKNGFVLIAQETDGRMASDFMENWKKNVLYKQGGNL